MLEYYILLKKKVNDTSNAWRKDVARHIISAMVSEMCNALDRIPHCNGERQMRVEKIFSDFIHLVEQNYKTERRVGWYGEQMCLSPKYLSETVKTVSRRSPNEWIDNYVTMELRAQLRNTTKSVKEIARDMNFPNQSFFGKYFKTHTGQTPSEYRMSVDRLRKGAVHRLSGGMLKARISPLRNRSAAAKVRRCRPSPSPDRNRGRAGSCRRDSSHRHSVRGAAGP